MLYEDRLAGRITPAQFEEWNREQREQQAQVRAEMRTIDDRLLALGRHVDVERVVEQLNDVGRVLRHLGPVELKRLVGEVVRTVRVVGDAEDGLRVEIAYRLPGLGAEPADVAHERRLAL